MQVGDRDGRHGAGVVGDPEHGVGIVGVHVHTGQVAVDRHHDAVAERGERRPQGDHAVGRGQVEHQHHLVLGTGVVLPHVRPVVVGLPGER